MKRGERWKGVESSEERDEEENRENEREGGEKRRKGDVQMSYGMIFLL